MSRLDLNGLRRPKCMENTEEDFEFGVLPEDEIERSPSPCEEIDAVNTVTFGEDARGTVDFDDLEIYSKQTAGLKLDDGEFTGWGIEPSCSISAPDPSQLPDPTFESTSGLYPNSHYSQSAFGASGMPYSSSFELNLGTVDSLFKNNAKTKENSIWGAPDLSSAITRSAMDFINKPDVAQPDLPRINAVRVFNDRPSPKAEPIVITPKKPVLAELPKNALTVEDLEREQLQQARSKKLPEVPRPSDGAMTLEELERQIMGSASSSKDEAKQLDASVPPDVKQLPTAQFPVSPQPPFSYPFPYPMMNPLMLNMYRGRMMTGQPMDALPGFPVLPPHLRMAFFETLARNPNALGGFRYPMPPQLPGMPVPPFPSLLQASRLRMCNARSPTSPRTFHAQNQAYGNGKNSIYREPQIKKTGLPSNKTISDFAFDPYAGFMSKKEREWLIKIQVLQCQGTGNPFDDDYYYTAWRERKLSLAQVTTGVKQEKADSDVTAATGSGRHYVPPLFVGSLGKPTLSTVNNPRQLIDLGRDGNEDDDRASVKGTSQKRFRALLMLIENIASYVLACEDRKRQLESSNIPDDVREQLQGELQSRIESLLNCLCGEKLSTVISLNKGRQMFLRTFSLVDSSQQLLLFNAFLNNALTPALKAVPEAELLQSLLPTFTSYLSQCSKEHLVKIICSFTVDGVFTVPSNLSNKFLCQMLLTVLLCASQKRVELNSSCASCALFTYLCGRRYPVQIPDEWYTMVAASASFTTEDVAFMRQWLQKKFQRYTGSVGHELGRKVCNDFAKRATPTVVES